MDTRLINQVIEWERILDIEDEKRKNHQPEPYADYAAGPELHLVERKSIFKWILKFHIDFNISFRSPEPPIQADCSR